MLFLIFGELVELLKVLCFKINKECKTYFAVALFNGFLVKHF